MTADPLSRYPAIRTSRVDEFEHQLRAVFGASGFVLPEPAALDVRGNFVELHDIALGFGACGTAVTINFAESDFARLQVPLRGQGVTRAGRESVVIGIGGACLTSPGQPTVIDYGVGFEQLFLRVSSQALRRKLERLLDMPVRHDLEFAPTDFAGASMLSGLQRLIWLLVTQLDDKDSLFSPLALREIEQAITVQLLFSSRHNFSGLLEKDARDPGSSHLRRVAAYIEANWNRPIIVETLVEVAGVSARSLYNGFEKAYGCPPMMFVKRVRLRNARELLTRPDETTTVTAVALACGFANLGHFASDYQAAFGERPSETLRRSRAR